MPEIGTLDALGWATVGAALAAVLAAGAAILQVTQGRAHFRRQATFDHLRRISDHVGRWVQWPDVSEIQETVLRYYCGEADSLSDHACEYLALLTELDLLAFASSRRMASRSIVRAYTRTIYHDDVVTPRFLREYQTACGSELPFRFLLNRLDEAAWAERHPWLQHFPPLRRIPMLTIAQKGQPKKPSPPPEKAPPSPRPPKPSPKRERGGNEAPVRENFPPPRKSPSRGGGEAEENK